MALVLLDIDSFKQVNDSCGHQQGNLVVKQVVQVIRDSSREADTPARYGGEEMALILPHTDLEGSFVIAERVRGAIEAARIRRLDDGQPLSVTASMGVAAVTKGEKEELIANADAALYRAKREGKNRTLRGLERVTKVAAGE